MTELKPCFLEVQFPVSSLSKESYKERKAGSTQTLTVLGRWHGRKPLILVRAAILGLLLPASQNPQKDREIFLKILTMDRQGLWLRKQNSITQEEVYSRLTAQERLRYFLDGSEKPRYKSEITKEEKESLQALVFSRMSYDEKLGYCRRPEQIEGPDEAAWSEINAHLGTNASSLAGLIDELSLRQFGHKARVGDAFCGGGSIPFEAARLGCEVYASDLNPLATLLTWSALHIVGGGDIALKQVQEAQKQIWDAVDKQITEWGIEHNEKGWRADAYLYCHETRCQECGWLVPLAPSWVIGQKSKAIAVLVPDKKNKRFAIEIHAPVSLEEMAHAQEAGTVKNSYLHCPHCERSTPIASLRKGGKTQSELRLWEKDEIVPRPEDVFQERLYCIRWVEEKKEESGKIQTLRHYAAPDAQDQNRESKILELLQKNFADWQAKGYLPESRIEPGDKTDEPIRTRGWTHWHHLFNPRQLLLLGCWSQKISETIPNTEKISKIACVLGLQRAVNYNSRLCRWASITREKVIETLSEQALDTLYNYASRGFLALDTTWFLDITPCETKHRGEILPQDVRRNNEICDIWITDPPYADAVNYHELSEFFLAWSQGYLKSLFPSWYTDSKRALAITGRDEDFRKSMVSCYQNLAQNMPENGAQIVMFTHQDVAVWADLALILWASGLRVTAAWCVATETDNAQKEGNYVQGTVLLVLRKQTSTETAFLDELYPKIEEEVKRQLDKMLALEDQEEPNFQDPDYQLAAYAAALRVLTQYSQIEDMDISRELHRKRSKTNDVSPVEEAILSAVKIACDHLVPLHFDRLAWKRLKPEERFYLKGLDIETHGEQRVGAYQELARGFGLREYKSLLHASKANNARLRTALEFEKKELGRGGFGTTLLRQALFAIHEAIQNQNAQSGKNWLRTEVPDYWSQRQTLIEIFQYLETMSIKLPHWQKDSSAASLLKGALENDHA